MSGLKRAFTLSEVLITLMIIGVVAAVTLPTMIANWQKQAAVSRLKKVYSTLYGAFNLSMAENGPLQTWDWELCRRASGKVSFIKTYIMPYFTHKEYCKYGGNDVCGYNWPEGFSDSLKNSVLKYLSFSEGYFVLNDGAVVLIDPFIYFEGTTIDIASLDITVITDINGSQKPNKFGRDIFFFKFNFNLKDNTLRAVPYMYDFFPGEDSHSRDYYLERVKNGDFISYFGIIWADGWQIKDDYPW